MDNRTAKIIAIIMCLITAACLAAAVVLSSESFTKGAADKLSVIASEAAGTKVELGTVSISSINSVEATDAAVYDKDEKLIGQAERIRVDFSLLSFLADEPIDAIKNVTAVNADVNIMERADGSFNFQDLISEEPGNSHYSGKIHIENSRLKLHYGDNDFLAESINGALNFSDYPVVEFDAEAVIDGSPVKAAGTANIDGSSFRVKAEADDILIEKYLRFLPSDTLPAEVKDISGIIRELKADIRLEEDVLSYEGQLKIENGQAVIFDKDVKNINGLLMSDGNSIKLFINASCMNQTAAAHGDIILTEDGPMVNLMVEAQSFDPGQIIEDIPYRGPLAFSAHLTGKADNPSVDGRLSVKEGEISGYSMKNASAHVFYSDSQLTADEISAELLGGIVSGQAEFNAKSYDFSAKLKLSGVGLSVLENMVPGIAGSVSADIVASGNANDMDSIEAAGSITSDGIAYNGAAISRLDGSFAKKGNVVTLDYVSARMANGGELGVEGTIALNESIDLSYYISAFDLSQTKAFEPDLDIAGIADIRGTISGPYGEPIIKAEYYAHDGEIFKQPFDTIKGTAGGSLRGVKINNLVMEHGDKTRWVINGMMGFLGDKGINLQADVTGARAEDLIKAVAPGQPLTGNVDNKISITGTLKNPHITGNVRFYIGSYDGVFLQGMDGEYEMVDNNIILRDFLVHSPYAEMKLNGTIYDMNRLELTVAAISVSMEKISEDLPYPVEGEAAFDGKLTGTIDSPQFAGTLKTPGLTMNGIAIYDAGGEITYQNKRGYIKNLGFNDGEGRMSFNGSIFTDSHSISGRLDVDGVDVNTLLTMGNYKNDKIFGKITGVIDISGTAENPQAYANILMNRGTAGGYDIRNVAIEADYQNSRINIKYLAGSEGENGSFAGQGLLDFDGAVEGRLSFNAIDAGMIAAVAGVQQPITGIINADIQASGTYTDPIVNASAEILDMGIGGGKIDSISGLFSMRNHVINIEQVVAKRHVNNNDYRVTMTGTVPLGSISDDASYAGPGFDISVDLDNAQLTSFPVMAKYVDWFVGGADGHLRLTGTKLRPAVNGRIDLIDSAIKPKGVTIPITEMNAVLSFTGNTVSIDNCSGRMGDGGYDIKGFAHWTGNIIDDYELSFDADSLELYSDFYKGPLNLHFTITDILVPNRGVLPKLTGNMLIENAIISIPTLPESSGELPYILTDFEVQLGKKVRFYSSQLADVHLAGEAIFKGSTLYPMNSGRIVVTKGYISYLKTNFKVFEGELDFNQPLSFYPHVKLSAGTTIANTRVLIDVSGPADAMNLKLISSPSMNEADIIKLLTLRSDYSSANSDTETLNSMVNIGLQMTILGALEAEMRNSLNLDLVTISRDTKLRNDIDDTLADEKYNIILGKYVTDDIMLRGSKSLTNDDYEIGVQYDFSDSCDVVFSIDEDNELSSLFEARITFN